MATTTDPATTGAGDGVQMVPLNAIDVVEGFNPRDERDADDFAQLVARVREYGVLQPVLVAPAEDGRFRLIAGEGRYRAAIAAGDKEIPARLRPVDDETGGVELALVENLVREQLDPVDEARGY
jgi:ParB family transcriptional regulator, chromosome partitioning protein